MKKRDRQRLLRAFDARLPARQQKELEDALGASDALQKENADFKRLRHLVAELPESRFSPFFSSRVMARLHSKERAQPGEDFLNALMGLFKPVMIGAAVVIVLLLSYNTLRNKGSLLSGLVTSPDVSMESVFDPTLVWMESSYE